MRALILALPLALCACAVPTAGTGTGSTAIVPVVANSVQARQAVVTAYKAYHVAIQATELLVHAKVITPGSPKALAIANLNDRINAALKAANHALDAGSEASYSAALNDAQVALSQLEAAIGSK